VRRKCKYIPAFVVVGSSCLSFSVVTSGKFGMFGSASAGSGTSLWSSTWVFCFTGSVSVAGTSVVAGGVFFNTRDELSVAQFVEGTLISKLMIHVKVPDIQERDEFLVGESDSKALPNTGEYMANSRAKER